MKTAHGCVTIVLVAAAFLMMGAAPPAKPLLQVQNGSMEQVAANAKLPTGYVQWGDPGLIQVDPTVAFEGKQSVKVVLSGESATVAMYQPVTHTVPEGMYCRFRVRVRTHDLDGQACLWVHRYPAPLTDVDHYSRKISGTQDWTTLEVTVPAKKDNQFQVFMLTTGTWGRVWWDNLEASMEEKP